MEINQIEYKDQFKHNKIIKNSKKKLFYISPLSIKFCTSPSNFCDYTQYNSSKIHPHAGINRGVFRENRMGYIKVNNFNWDKKKGPEFIKLLEYIALKEHYLGKRNWKNSHFAERNIIFIKNGNIVRGFNNPKKFLVYREKAIDRLFEHIIKKGVIPYGVKNNKKSFNDNISVNLDSNLNLLFNNRGHHRLSIAKILKLNSIPIKLTIVKSEKIFKEFNFKCQYR